MALSFIVDERFGLKEEVLGFHLGSVVSLHAHIMFHEAKLSLSFTRHLFSRKRRVGNCKI